MRRHAKASSAGSTQRQATGLGRIFRGALATRGAAPAFGGSGAPSGWHLRTLLLALFVAALTVALATSSASAAKTLLFTIGTGTDGPATGQLDDQNGVAANNAAIADGGLDPLGNSTDGYVYVGDEDNHRVQVFDSEGTFQFMFGRNVNADLPGTGAEVCDRTENCQGGTSGTFVGTAAGEMDEVQAVAIDQSDGSVYVGEDDNARISKFDSAGNFVLMIGKNVNTDGLPAPDVCLAGDACKIGVANGTESSFTTNFIGSMTVDPASGELYVADEDNARIQVFDSAGVFQRAYGYGVDDGTSTPQVCTAGCQPGLVGSEPGQFDEPTDVAIDDGGHVFVSDDDTDRVTRFDNGTTFSSPLDFAPLQLSAASPPGWIEIDTGASAGITDDRFFVVQGSTSEGVVRELSMSGVLLDTHGAGAGFTNPGIAGGLGYDRGTGTLYLSDDGEALVFALRSLAAPAAKLDAIAPVTGVGATTATFHGEVDPTGSPTNYRFEYRPVGAATWSAVPQPDGDAGSGTGFLAVAPETVTNLEPNTAYEVRLTATKPFGGPSHASAPASFSTDPAPPQLVRVGSFPGGTDTSAVLFASIDPESAHTTYRFEYGTDTSYGQSTPTVEMGSGAASEPVFAQVNDLEPGTTYHFKAVATNPSGTVESADATFTLATSPDCPNDAFRVGPSANLPDCRAYEMVSPLDKNGGDIETGTEDFAAGSSLGSSYRQVSVDGGKITYSSSTAFGDAVGGHWSSQYISSRGPEGWSTHGIAARRWTTIFEPVIAVAANFRWFTRGFFQGFTPDLSSAWVRDDNMIPLAPDGLEGFVNIYRRDNGADWYEALTNEGPYGLIQAPGDINGPGVRPDLGQSISSGGPRFIGASNDLRHQVFAVNAPLTPDAREVQGFEEPRLQLYDLVGGELHLVSVLPDGSAAATHSFAGTIGDEKLVATQMQMIKNAISDDGSRIFWSASSSASGPGTIYLRENPGEEQSAIVASECIEPDKACTIPVSGSVGPGASQFWAAAADGSEVLFSQGAHPNRSLYVFDADTRTPTEIAGQSAGVAATSEDLSHLYFVSRQAKAPGALAGDNNLYHYHDGNYALIGTVTENDLTQICGSLGSTGASVCGANMTGVAAGAGRVQPVYNQTRVTPDGSHFAFMSNSAALAQATAGYDNTDAITGKPDFEVYRYDAEAEGLSCVSCNPTGAQPRGILLRQPYNPSGEVFSLFGFPHLRTAATIPTHEHDNYTSRILSDDGNRLFFHTNEALLPRDSNGVQDVYQWQAPDSGSCEVGQSDYFPQNDGCISLISTGRDDAKSEFVDATPDGSEVYISTDEGLDPRDPGLRDIYVAKIDGGFPMPTKDALCEGEACQSPPVPPDDPTPNSLSFQGPGNPAAQGSKPKARCPKGKRRVKARGGKTRCVKRKRSDKRAKSKRASNERRASR